MARSLFKPAPGRGEAPEGVYADLSRLIRLRFDVRGFTLKPRQPVHSVLAGRRASRLRGRGLDFEELRRYAPGDDVRTIDWKATARLRSPHVRAYTEERDRPCVLVVDQRKDMFFGSREKMKSVLAAEAAAIGAWRVIDEGDRVGAVVFGEVGVTTVRPQRSDETVMQILRAVVDANHALSVDAPRSPGHPLNEALETASAMVRHDGLVVVISDFGAADERSRRLWTRVAAHNDTLAVRTVDPLEVALPRRVGLAFERDGVRVDLDSQATDLRSRFKEAVESRAQRAEAFLRRVECPTMHLTTEGSVVEQIRQQIGIRSRGRDGR